MNIERSLHEEIVCEFEELSKMTPGTEEYKTTVDGLTKLVDRAIEMEKLHIDEDDKVKTRESEENWKSIQLKEERLDRVIRNCLTGLGIIIPAGLTIWGTVKSIEFEKEGTITTIMGRGFINKLLPKK